MALWGGRFSSGPEESMAALSRSVHFDWCLAKYDVKVNLVNVEGLIKSGLLSEGNGEIIKAGLKALSVEISNGKFTYSDADEDVHSAIERGLVEKIGSIGGAIRAGRSRNDLVITDFKLYLIDNLVEIAELLTQLVEAINKQATANLDVIAPGFTHLQHAQPVSFGHELAKHSHSLLRDISRIEDWLDRNSLSPFGASALAGSPLQLDPEALADAMDFEGVLGNSIDAVSDRDFVAEALSALAIIGVHLSRIGEEFTIWNSSEFGWVTLDDKFSTGSSIMPQKKNPDVAELARGKAGRLIGNLTAMLTTMKGLAFAYNRDLQEDKEPIFDSIQTLTILLPAITGMIATAKFNKEAIQKGAISGFALATEIADYLALAGVPFSEAHEVSGAAVKYCESVGKEINELSEAELAKIDARLKGDLLAKLNALGAVNSRTSSLGTSISSVSEQLGKLQAQNKTASLWISNAQKAFSGMMSL
jgi:argininosuccinate lyase